VLGFSLHDLRRTAGSRVKHARSRIDGSGSAAASQQPVLGLGKDLRLETSERPLKAGAPAGFQVLRDGQPLAGLPVELRSDLSPVGIWRSTDDQGRVWVVLPLAARWILRGTDPGPAADGSDRWGSRSVTLGFALGFEVYRRPRRPRRRRAPPASLSSDSARFNAGVAASLMATATKASPWPWAGEPGCGDRSAPTTTRA
jgi:hypothetical protein